MRTIKSVHGSGWWRLACCGALLIWFAAAAIAGETGAVTLVRCAKDQLELKTGPYRLALETLAGRGQWLTIRAVSADSAATSAPALATRLANGLDLDLTTSGVLRAADSRETSDTITVDLQSSRAWADFASQLTLYKRYPGLVRWRVEATVKRDKVFDGDRWELREPDVHFVQGSALTEHEVTRWFEPRGPATGMLYFYDHALGASVFYLEDYSSLNHLYELTGCANPYHIDREMNPGAVSMGYPTDIFQWAEKDGVKRPPQPWQGKTEKFEKFGYRRPLNYRLKAGERVVLGDTYLYLTPGPAGEPAAFCRRLVERLAIVYQYLYKPPLETTDWAGEAVPGLIDSLNDPANWSEQGGHRFPRSYVHHQHATAELLTVGELLVPLTEYVKRFPEQVKARRLKEELDALLPLYWDERWQGFGNGTTVPENSFYQSWYLLWHSVNVSDLALAGNPDALRMIQGFRNRLLELGRRCNYVFAAVNTTTYEQNGIYQFDVTGEYLYAMMALYRLSGGRDQECLAAAKAAASRIMERGFDYAYELNGTATGAVGCQWLFEATKDARDQELAYIPLANALRWALLWECDYGVGKHVTSFWGFCPTPGNNNLAEHEAHHALRFLRQFRALAGATLTPEVEAMLRDSSRYGAMQSRYTLPPYLLQAGAGWSLAQAGLDETDCGVIDAKSFVPLEDMHVGWCTDPAWHMPNPRNGVIGQEIYGAGGPIWHAIWAREDQRQQSPH